MSSITSLRYRPSTDFAASLNKWCFLLLSMRRNRQVHSRIFFFEFILLLHQIQCTNLMNQAIQSPLQQHLLNEFQCDSFTYAINKPSYKCMHSNWKYLHIKLLTQASHTTKITSRIWKSICRNETRHNYKILARFIDAMKKKCELKKKTSDSKKNSPRPFNQRHSKNNVM